MKNDVLVAFHGVSPGLKATTRLNGFNVSSEAAAECALSRFAFAQVSEQAVKKHPPRSEWICSG